MNGSIKLMGEQSASLLRLMRTNAAPALHSDDNNRAQSSNNSVASSLVQFDPTNMPDMSIAGSAS